MIPIKIVGERALVFDLDDIKLIRELGITGMLSGTLPMLSQQNVFLGVPLQLMREEVIWLVEQGHAYLIPSEIFYRSLRASLLLDELQHMTEQKALKLESQRLEKESALQEKYRLMGIDRKNHDGSNTQMSYFYEIYNTSKDVLDSYETFQQYYNKPDFQLKSLEQFKQMTTHTEKDDLNYAIFKDLKEKDFYLAPGLRFGGKFIAYPGDPLIYHSHLMINGKDFYNEDIGLNNIVNGGRLATAVKKVWTVAGETSEKEVKYFSIEWSGFG